MTRAVQVINEISLIKDTDLTCYQSILMYIEALSRINELNEMITRLSKKYVNNSVLYEALHLLSKVMEEIFDKKEKNDAAILNNLNSPGIDLILQRLRGQTKDVKRQQLKAIFEHNVQQVQGRINSMKQREQAYADELPWSQWLIYQGVKIHHRSPVSVLYKLSRWGLKKTPVIRLKPFAAAAAPTIAKGAELFVFMTTLSTTLARHTRHSVQSGLSYLCDSSDSFISGVAAASSVGVMVAIPSVMATLLIGGVFGAITDHLKISDINTTQNIPRYQRIPKVSQQMLLACLSILQSVMRSVLAMDALYLLSAATVLVHPVIEPVANLTLRLFGAKGEDQAYIKLLIMTWISQKITHTTHAYIETFRSRRAIFTYFAAQVGTNTSDFSSMTIPHYEQHSVLDDALSPPRKFVEVNFMRQPGRYMILPCLQDAEGLNSCHVLETNGTHTLFGCHVPTHELSDTIEQFDCEPDVVSPGAVTIMNFKVAIGNDGLRPKLAMTMLDPRTKLRIEYVEGGKYEQVALDGQFPCFPK